MSSTSNIQNLLVNVFRPSVAYDPSTGYVPKLNICNVDTISAKSLAVTTFGIGDSNGNVFLGSNAGGSSSNTNNTAVGISAGSGMANTTSCVYIGNIAGIGAQGASNVISIGKEARGAGSSNVYIGSGTGSSNASSANNILIGHGLDYSNQVLSNTLQIGRPGSLVIQGNLANKQVGINTAPAYALDVCGDFSFHNSNGNFTYALDSSGDTQIDFRSSNVGKKAVMNIVGDVYGQTFYGGFSGSITTPSVTMGSGSITAPSYSFSNDTSTGFYYNLAPAYLGVTVRGCNSMIVNTTGVGIGKTATTQLDVSGTTTSSNLIIPGYARNAATPTTWDISGGNMFLQSNLKLQTLTATGDISATGTIYGSFVSTGTTTSNIYVPGFIRNTVAGFNLDISSGNISNSGIHIASNFFTTSTSNSFIGGVSLNDCNITTFGRFSNLDSTSNRIGGVTISNSLILSNNLLGSLVLRNALTPTTYDISGGNISNSATTTSSNFHVGSGTAGAPSYAFSTDTTLGLYRVGANQLGFATAGVQRMVLSSNDVGIGTTTPTFRLDVCGSPGSNSAGAARITNTLMITNKPNTGATPISGIRIFSDTSAQYFQYGSDISGSGTGTASLNFTPMASATPILTLASNQNIGIGTSNPGYMLDVVKSGTGVSSDIRILAGTTGASSTNTASTIYQIKGAGGGDVSTAFKMDLQTVGGYGVSVLNAANTPYVRFDSTNNRLGVANIAPSYTLDVCGTARIANTLFISDTSSTTSGGFRIRPSSTIQYFQWGPNISSGVSDAQGVKLIFSGINLSGTYMTIDQTNSNVGIGTTAPNYRLDVCAAPTVPSINMSTWPRTSMSNTYYGSGTTRSTAAVIYTTNTSIDSNLVTVASNNGTYFTINKSGIYSIVAFIVGSTGGTYDAWIDASTNIAHSGAGSDTTIIVGKTGFNGEGRFTLTYSGYLPSNANMYYKTKISANMSSISTARLHITFLQETPTYTGFFI